MSQVLPKTIDDAIEQIKVDLGQEQLDYLMQLKEENLTKLHFSLGVAIRRDFGLWHGNPELVKDLRGRLGKYASADTMSHYLIECLREQLQQENQNTPANTS